MLSLSASFRSLTLASATVPIQAVRAMATKAAGSSTATSTRAKKTDLTLKATKDAKTTKTTKTIKEASNKKIPTEATKSKKAEPVKPKKIAPLELPKRPSSPWTLFFKEHLDKVKASGKTVVPVQETVNASAAWKQLTPDQKQVYEDRYRANMEDFKRQMEQRLQELTPAEFGLENSRRRALRATGKKNLPSLKDPNAPKRPLSSFFRFVQEQRAAGEFASLPVKERTRSFADAWAKVPESEKARYAEQARNALAEYKAAKAAYEAERQ
ncbi:exp1-like protein [Lobosporangium transversale]|uniref:HMG box domain-containing protein n=1 Tax=Lobosporangium transversale TaxID=64571 RepID=A0A1Y2GQW7_9FUNG|nr:hypothetical protein BCR41DRAFT_350999 [Lobosporangium transversale]KAF9910089.1 exp1-like protein [Lobosporangium transversale]ORZ19935.1 hypothetical protein BCR41DRAFT_350999 [Lobosporangium transversale]|eukprot:XP_021882475.1 hypothetical protein BCR41DRAFT_350999 [Lobosporangium transversale]